MSLRACELNGNGSHMFACLQIRLRSWFGSFDEFGFAVSPWTNFSLNLFLYNAWAIKSYSICFQVQNVIFPDCLTMHALVFFTKSYGCFSFVCLFVSSISKKHVIFIICLVFWTKSFIWVSIFGIS
jgi:hypothetical protein